LLDTYVPVLKPKGRFVYATCSILACEGEDQLRWFLSTHRSFRLLSERRLWPDRDGTDGFYMALCEKI
jgi:16S rRNA (cytosine967-C5)-methyltransferase